MLATLQIISGSELRDIKARTNDYNAFGSVTSYNTCMQQIVKFCLHILCWLHTTRSKDQQSKVTCKKVSKSLKLCCKS